METLRLPIDRSSLAPGLLPQKADLVAFDGGVARMVPPEVPLARRESAQSWRVEQEDCQASTVLFGVSAGKPVASPRFLWGYAWRRTAVVWQAIDRQQYGAKRSLVNQINQTNPANRTA